MKSLLTVLSVIFFSLYAEAGQLKQLRKAEVDTASRYMVRYTGHQVLLWCSCCSRDSQKLFNVKSVGYREILSEPSIYSDRAYELVLTGEVADGKRVDRVVDLAYVWVPIGDLAHNLAKELGLKAKVCSDGFHFPGDSMSVAELNEHKQVYTYVEQMPQPTVNIPKFFRKNMVYPTQARDSDIQGKVIVKFIVDEGGNITNVRAATNLGGGLEEEAIRVVKLTGAWKPGLQNGKPVKVNYTLPVVFRLTGRKLIE